jgi:hypothetical protein
MGHSRHRRSKQGTGSAWLPGLMLGLALLATVIIVCGVIIYVEQPSSTSDDTSPEGYIRAKLAEDDDAGRFRDVIADSASLERLHAMDDPTALVTARAYYRSGDKPGCVKYIVAKFPFASVNPSVAPLLKRCQQS